MNNSDFWQSLIRRFVTYAAGSLAAHGWIVQGSSMQADIEIIVSAIMVIGTTVWTSYHQKKMKSVNDCGGKENLVSDTKS